MDAAALLLFPLVFGAVAVRLGQDLSGDELLYHYYGPYALLHGRQGIDVTAAGLGSFHNAAMYVPWYLATRVLPAGAVGFLLGAVQGLNGTLLYAIGVLSIRASPGVRRLVAFAAAVAGTACVTQRFELGTTFFDNVASLPVLAAVWLSVRRGSGPNPWAMGLLLGAAAGVKLPFATYAIAAPIAFAASRRVRLPQLARMVVATGLGFVAVAGPMMVVLHRHYGNPLFPYYNGLFHSPFFANVNWRDERWAFHGVLEFIRSPLYFVRDTGRIFEPPFFDVRWLVFFTVCVPAALGWRRLAAPVRFLVVFVAGSYAVWAVQFAYLRYLVGAELVAMTAVASVLVRPSRASRWRAGAAVAIAVTIALTTRVASTERKPWSHGWFEVHPPRFAQPADVAVSLESDIGFVVPFFQPEITFVGLNSNFFGVNGLQGPLYERARDVLRHKKSYHLAQQGCPDHWKHFRTDELYRSIGLMIDRPRCSAVVTNVRPLEICPLVPFSPSAPHRAVLTMGGSPGAAPIGGAVESIQLDAGGAAVQGWADWRGYRDGQRLRVYADVPIESARLESVPRLDVAAAHPLLLMGTSGFRLALRWSEPARWLCVQSDDPQAGTRELASSAGGCERLRSAAANAPQGSPSPTGRGP